MSSCNHRTSTQTQNLLHDFAWNVIPSRSELCCNFKYLTSFPPCAKAPNAAVKICKNPNSLPVLGSSVTLFRASISKDIPRDLALCFCASLSTVPFSSQGSISTLESQGDSMEDRRLVSWVWASGGSRDWGGIVKTTLSWSFTSWLSPSSDSTNSLLSRKKIHKLNYNSAVL